MASILDQVKKTGQGIIDATVNVVTNPSGETFEEFLRKATAQGMSVEAAQKAWDKSIGLEQKKEKEALDERDENMDKALEGFDNLESPDFDYSDFEKGTVFNQSDSEFGNISEDPRLRDAQMRSLSSLEEIGSSGGLLAVDKALLAKTQRDAASQDRGRREAILQGQAARGMGGTGNALLAQLDSSQAATERSNQAGLDIAGMAQDRSLNAILQAGTLSGNIRGQEFDQNARKAQAQDAINNFNAGQNTWGSFQNAGIGNDQKQYHNGLKQTTFGNQQGIAQDRGNILTGKAANSQKDAGTAAGKQGAYVDALGNIIKTGAKAYGGGA